MKSIAAVQQANFIDALLNSLLGGSGSSNSNTSPGGDYGAPSSGGQSALGGLESALAQALGGSPQANSFIDSLLNSMLGGNNNTSSSDQNYSSSNNQSYDPMMLMSQSIFSGPLSGRPLL